MRALAAALVLAACAADPPAPPQPAAPGAAACSVTVQFGSFATGIDGKAAAKVDRMIASDPSVTSVTRSRPGIEGEYSLCVGAASRVAAIRLFERLRDAIAAGPVQAPVSVASPEGTFSPRVEQRR